MPVLTPDDTRTRCGVATFGRATFVPPPPLLPPPPPAQRSARNPTGNAAHDAGSSCNRRRRFVLLNHLDLLWNLGRGAQLAINDIGLDLVHNFDRCGGWAG